MVFRLLLISIIALADPWGVDADLAQPPIPKPPKKRLSIAARIAAEAVRFHQHILHPIQGERSHFRPTSSHYTLQAIKHYGFIKGFLMGCDRLQRENDEAWIYPTRTIAGRRWKWDPPEEAEYSHYEQ